MKYATLILLFGAALLIGSATAKAGNTPFLEAVAFYFNELVIKAPGDRVELPLETNPLRPNGIHQVRVYSVSKDDPCVVFIEAKAGVTGVNFRKLPGSRSMPARRGSMYDVAWWGIHNLPSEALCFRSYETWEKGAMCYSGWEWTTGYGLQGAMKRLNALDYIHREYCPGLPDPDY